MNKPISPVDETCTFWPKGQCERPFKERDACWKCAEDVLKKVLIDTDGKTREVRNPLVSGRILAWNIILKSWDRLENVHSLDSNVYSAWYRTGSSKICNVPPAGTKYEQPKS